MSDTVLVCWHSKNGGVKLAETTIGKLEKKEIDLTKVFYLYQPEFEKDIPDQILNIPVHKILVPVTDPTIHIDIYQHLKNRVIPLLRNCSSVHLNISPGTPAMHAVWLLLHAGGAFPENTRLWSTQWKAETKRTSLNAVNFPVSTYLAELHHSEQQEPQLAYYDIEAQSFSRRSALDKLSRYAQVRNAPLLLLGERGTGKTRLVESIVKSIKSSEIVVSVPCGGLDHSVLESTIFGHEKGAFTGAVSKRKGLLQTAESGILFLDEVQDLPKNIQRKLVRVLQDFRHRYRPLGSDEEISTQFQLVCASNKTKEELSEVLDPDFYDRISHLSIMIPPLRECREDIFDDWKRVWLEMGSDPHNQGSFPWNSELQKALNISSLQGNLRTLQRLALLIMVWRSSEADDIAISKALDEWNIDEEKNTGNRDEKIKRFRYKLAHEAKKSYGTWEAAANALDCTEKTLRVDSKLF